MKLKYSHFNFETTLVYQMGAIREMPPPPMAHTHTLLPLVPKMVMMIVKHDCFHSRLYFFFLGGVLIKLHTPPLQSCMVVREDAFSGRGQRREIVLCLRLTSLHASAPKFLHTVSYATVLKTVGRGRFRLLCVKADQSYKFMHAVMLSVDPAG